MTVGELVAAFLRDRELGGRSAETLAFYRARLETLRPVWERAADSLALGDLQNCLAAAQTGKRGKPVGQSTRHHNANAITILQRWAVDNELIPKLWARKLPKPGVATRNRIPTDEETRALLRGARPDFVRMYNALRISGARPGELCRARIEDLRSDGKSRWIELEKHKTAAKTGRVRKIPIGAKFGAMVDRAVAQRTAGPIFTRRDGAAWTPQTLSAIFRRRRDRLGLSRELCLYLARHEAGTRIVMTSGIEQAARVLGHAPGSQVTARYSHLAIDYLGACQDAEPGAPDS